MPERGEQSKNILSFDMAFEAVDRAVPLRRDRADPRFGGEQAGGVDPVPNLSSLMRWRSWYSW